jgi:glycosyltransferase involved in cell wall biosynthesis
MIGSGKEEEAVIQRVQSSASLAKHVILTGFQSREICHDLRRASNVSLCLMGGFSLIEACAAGSPVVSYDVEWHGELVKSGETGFLLREGDIEGVATALEWLLDHGEEGQVMGQKGKSLAFELHSLSNASATKIRWYKELLSMVT